LLLDVDISGFSGAVKPELMLARKKVDGEPQGASRSICTLEGAN
jgi:hypothetical protein